MVRFHQQGTTLYAEIRNPNATIGLVRSGFNLALLDRSDGVITVGGGEGFPGAPCCTIYHLPPGGTYYLVALDLPARQRVSAVELETFGDWFVWADLEPAVVTLTNTKLRFASRGSFDAAVTMTGRVTVSDDGPYNVRVQVLIENRKGAFSVLDESVDCVRGGRARPFELSSFNEVPARARATTVLAFPSTVIGAEGTEQEPPGCP